MARRGTRPLAGGRAARPEAGSGRPRLRGCRRADSYSYVTDTSAVTRSGVLGIVTMTISSFALVGVLACAFFGLWLPAIALGAFMVCAMAASIALIRRADPAELVALAARNERWLYAWGRGMGKVAGGWEPRRSSRDGRPPQEDSRDG